MRGTKTTIVDFYQSAYGPTIRIDVQSIEWLRLFKKGISQLLSKNISELDIFSLKDAEKDEISGFTITLGLSAGLSMIPNILPDKYPLFNWTVDEEHIKFTIEAIDRFLDCDNPGHYYLYEEDINIEFAYKE